MKKIRLLSVGVYMLSSQVFASSLGGFLYFDCKSTKQASYTLTGFLDNDVVSIFQDSKKLYILHRLPSPGNCPKSSCSEWSNQLDSQITDSVSLWYDPYLSPDEANLKITRLDGTLEKFVCSIDA